MFQVNKVGHFKLGQICIKIGGADFLLWLNTDQWFTVEYNQPQCAIKPAHGGKYAL